MSKTINKSTKATAYLFAALAVVVAIGLPVAVLAQAPVVNTQRASKVEDHEATLNGEITDHGRHSLGIYNKSYVWFEYGKNISYGNETDERAVEGVNSFSEDVENLSACTVYHVRAVAENESEKAYGEDIIFTTKCRVSSATRITVRNITNGDGSYHKSLSANPFDKLLFRIVVESTGQEKATKVTVKNSLPANVNYLGNLKISGEKDTRDISQQAIEIGDIDAGDSKTITFEAQVGPSNASPTGLNKLAVVAVTYAADTASTDSAIVRLDGTGAGIASTGSTATRVNTGVGSDILNSILLPLLAAMLIVWVFRSELLGLDKAVEKRKATVDKYRATKKLSRMIKKR